LIQGNGFTIKESKFDYFFGRVTSSAHNQQRSLQNWRDLANLGIVETVGGKGRLMEIFQAGLTSPEVRRITNDYGTTVIRKVAINGTAASGAIEIAYFYPGSTFAAKPEVTSIIPKLYFEESV
jgi:hypothetical protein